MNTDLYMILAFFVLPATLALFVGIIDFCDSFFRLFRRGKPPIEKLFASLFLICVAATIECFLSIAIMSITGRNEPDDFYSMPYSTHGVFVYVNPRLMEYACGGLLAFVPALFLLMIIAKIFHVRFLHVYNGERSIRQKGRSAQKRQEIEQKEGNRKEQNPATRPPGPST